ncbi:SURF1 family protein [Actimicrobium antarcticum]|uniref:SURF1-like protein n=1 Tax=Actimicrobium antarcticum TaxID=1051899 RepID=A0ABP7T8U2_9BURK
MRIRFHFRLIPFVAASLLVLLGIVLGQWQTQRALAKQQIETSLAARAAAPALVLGENLVKPEDAEYRRVNVRGHFVADWPVYLDNRPYNGRPGAYVVMPFKIDGSSLHVLIERGWIPLNIANRSKIYPFQTPAGDVDISGIARRRSGHVMQLGSPAPLTRGAMVQNLDLAEFAQASGMTLQPILIEQAASPNDQQEGLVRDWPKPSSGIDMHRGYAFQWYALALMAFIFFVVTGFRREAK